MTRDPQSLSSVFGFHDFRGRQGEVVDRVMAGEHTLAVMPTGAGKSLCYQIPALARDRHGARDLAADRADARSDPLGRGVGIRAASLTSADADRARDDRAADARRARLALRRAGAGDAATAFASCSSASRSP